MTDLRPSGTMRTALPRTSVGAVRVRIPFLHPFATATGTWSAREAWIVRLVDASGRAGFGEASLDPGAGPDADARLTEVIRNAVDELAVAGTVEPWLAADDPMTEPARRAVRGAIVGAALDLGLVDLPGLGVAPGVGVPPTSRPIRVNATIATEERGETVMRARDAAATGFTCLKVKGGSERSGAELVERLAAVRSAVGPDIGLRLDVNGAWDLTTASERIGTLATAGLGLEYVEQPIPPGDIAALADLRRSTPIRIAADESVGSRWSARALLDAEAVDVLVVKPGRVGGPLDALAIAQDAVAVGVEVTISTLLETGIGLGAALRVAAALPDDLGHVHAHGLATADVLASDLLATPLAIVHGTVAAPVRDPGQAIDIDIAAIDRYAVDRIGWPA